MATNLQILLDGRSVDIVRQSREPLTNVLQTKFGCVAVIEGMDFQHDFGIAQRGRPTVEDQPRFSVQLQGGVQLSVWKGDLTVFQADAVVNAANIDLNHCGGLALSLSTAGGPEVQKESNDYIRKNGPLETGEAIVTGPGKLQCRHIIHAVGPDLPPSPTRNEVSKAKPLLKKAIESILYRVKQNNLQSVAIPAISSGLFHYPLAQCADTIVSTVKEYYSNYNPHKPVPKEIFLVNHDEPTVVEMTKACQQIFGQHRPMFPGPSSQAAAKKSRDDNKTSTHCFQIGNVHLKLMKGRIEEQQTDVIVNTTSKDRDLKMGLISKCLLEKAGDKMQQEIRINSPTGTVIITKGYNLSCDNVFHTCFTDLRGLSESVSECLWLAVTHKHKSIAFPAIGTGNLRFSGKDVSKIMVNEVADFAQKSKNALEVHFIIFPRDSFTFQAFEEQMKSLKERASSPGFELAFNSPNEFKASKASSPLISLNGPSEQATREAKKWLEGLLLNSGDNVIICNNFILHFGEQEHQQLSRLTQEGVQITEFFDKGHAGIMVKGEFHGKVAVAALQVEVILCKIQEEFVRDEEREIRQISTKNLTYERKEASPQEYKDRLSLLWNDMRVIKVEKVENPALEMLFELKKNQLSCSTTRTMFQCIPAQFIEMVCLTGFHAECAPPRDPAFGEGIYFAGTQRKALDVWERHNEEFVYFVEAEVLTGNSALGKPGLILPPAVGADPQTLYNSVNGGPDISVIFSGYQALPRYIITCEVPSHYL